MAVSRCPHCDQLLLPDELLAPACANCGGALPGATAEAAAPTAAPAPVPPPRPRTPRLLWAAVVGLAVSNVATLALLLWPRETYRPVAVVQQHAIAEPSPPQAAPAPPIKPVNDSPEAEIPKPVEKPAAPASDVPKSPVPAPPPAPMPAVAPPNPPAPPPVAANPPVPLPPPPGLTDIEGMQGRIDRNDAGEVVGLRLGNSGLSDNELCLLQPFDHLQELDLDHTPVTDKGLIYLQRLKALRSLSLRGAAVTDAGVAALQQALPGVKIAR